MRRSQADSTNRSLAAFGKLHHIRRGHVAPILFRSELHESFNLCLPEISSAACTLRIWRCLRRSLLIRPPLAVRTTMRAAATRPRQFRRPPQTRADGQAAL